jgi:N-acetylmuramoyl-L-alanine amidase
MTRDGAGYRGGNVERAQFCNRDKAALMLRIHADGSTDPSLHGVATLAPALHRGWTDDIYGRSLRAARLVQQALVVATDAADRGVVLRSDLTGFNWANVPAILVETGFLSNAAERRRLHEPAYRLRVARGLARGVAAFVRP